jgi:hypothetical protein
MKRQVFRFLTMLSLLLMLSAMSVNAQSTRVTMNIPFDFSVGQRTLPAGIYTIEPSRRDSRNIWLLQNKAGTDSVLFATNSVWTNRNQEQNRLVFRKYSQRHVLSQIWSAGESSGRELSRPKWVYELTKNGVRPEYVVLNANQ